MVHGNKGKTAWNKGKKDWVSEEHRESIRHSNKTRIWTAEMREKISKAHKGRVSPMKGYRYTPQQRIQKCFAMRNSEKFHNAIQKRDEEKVKEFLRKLYRIPESVEFFPASKYDHNFARLILIEHGYSYGFVHIRLREHPEWVKCNQNESRIPVVL